jgi:protease II
MTIFLKGLVKISPSHQKLLYSLDTTGDESYVLMIKDIPSGKILGVGIDNFYWDEQTFSKKEN